MDAKNGENHEERNQAANKEAEEAEQQQEQAPPRQPTQAELDAQSKRRAAGRSTGRAMAPASRPGVQAVSEPAPRDAKGAARSSASSAAAGAAAASSGAAASREAVERNMEDRDALAKRRAAARGGPAARPGAVSSSATGHHPEPPPPPARVETAATVEAPPTAGTMTSVPAEYDEAKPSAESYAAEDVTPGFAAVANVAPAAAAVAASATAGMPDSGMDDQTRGAIQAAVHMDGSEYDVEKAEEEAAEAAVVAHVSSTLDHNNEAVEEAPAYPYTGTDPALAEGVVADGIEAFVADTVVDATGVAVVMSEEEEEKFEQGRRKKYLCYGAIVLVIVAVSIVVPVVLLVGGDGKVKVVEQPPSIAPSSMPSSMPSAAPTSDTFSMLLDFLKGLTVSTEDLFDSRNSPQYQAALWLADDDEYVQANGLNLEDPRLLQRYALASLYYSTGGDNWKLCGADSPSCGDTTWLTDPNECDWFIVDCDADGVVSQINFRKYFIPLHGIEIDCVFSALLFLMKLLTFSLPQIIF